VAVVLVALTAEAVAVAVVERVAGVEAVAGLGGGEGNAGWLHNHPGGQPPLRHCA
jgi:hypothetical protein